MAVIKSFTDLEQSKKLAEILPLEIADMHYVLVDTDEDKYAAGLGKYIGILPHYPCWSLASLLGVLPKYELYNFGDTIQLDVYREALATEGDETLLDLVVNMIIRLHELSYSLGF